MTWMIILSLNVGVTPLIETKTFHTQETCEQFGQLKQMRDNRYTYFCTDIKESK